VLNPYKLKVEERGDGTSDHAMICTIASAKDPDAAVRLSSAIRNLSLKDYLGARHWSNASCAD
jgi:hypothetical protein